MTWGWPLGTNLKLWPDEPGQFGYRRKYEY